MKVNVEVSDELYEKLSRRAQRKGFDSAEQYSAVILETVVDELETESQNEDMKDRLSDLGYLE